MKKIKIPRLFHGTPTPNNLMTLFSIPFVTITIIWSFIFLPLPPFFFPPTLFILHFSHTFFLLRFPTDLPRFRVTSFQQWIPLVWPWSPIRCHLGSQVSVLGINALGFGETVLEETEGPNRYRGMPTRSRILILLLLAGLGSLHPVLLILFSCQKLMRKHR